MKGTTMTTNTRPLALVTGASGGIGEELARELAKNGHDLVLVARSEGRLRTVASELASAHSISAHIITADLGVPGAGHALATEIAARGFSIDVLVNNAGFADFGDMWKADANKLDSMILLNMATLTELMHDLLPAMVQRKHGRIMNVASTAAFFPGPLMAVYYATKAYVLSLSEGVNEELKGTGVTVTALCPGPTESGFQTAAAMEDSKLVKGRKIMTAEKVAQLGVAAMLQGKPVIVTGLKNKFMVQTPKFTPRRLIPGIVKRAQAASH
jgi:uncharacterized protein